MFSVVYEIWSGIFRKLLLYPPELQAHTGLTQRD